jgi:hypothetical protein
MKQTHAKMEAKYGPATHFQIFEIFKKIEVLFNPQQLKREKQTGCRSGNFALRNELKDYFE